MNSFDKKYILITEEFPMLPSDLCDKCVFSESRYMLGKDCPTDEKTLLCMTKETEDDETKTSYFKLRLSSILKKL